MSLRGQRFGQPTAFSSGVNVASIEAFSPVSNSAISNSTKPAVNVSSICALPSRNLVGFLSLLTGILGPNEAGSVPASIAPPANAAQPESVGPPESAAGLVTLQPAKPGSIDGVARTSRESEKEGRNISRAQKAGKIQATLNRPDPQLVTRYAPVAAQPSLRISSIAPLAGEALESAGSSSEPRWAPLQPNGPANESAASVAFALRLTPQNNESTTSTVSAPQARPGVGTWLNAAQSSMQEQPLAPPLVAAISPTVGWEAPFPSPRQNVDPGVRPGGVGFQGVPRQLVQPDFVELPSPQESDSLPRNPEPISGLTQTRESLPALNQSEAGPKTDAVQKRIPMVETAIPGEPTGASPDGGLEKGRTGSAPQAESGMTQTAFPRQALATAPGNAPTKRPVGSTQEPLNHQGQEKNDPEPDEKASKLYPADKLTTNQKDARVQDAPGFCGILPGPSIGVGQMSPRTEPAPLDPLTSARVQPDIESSPSIRPQPMREISLQLADDASNQVDIQVLARAGKVEVAVRTADQELTKSLQTNLGELVGRMEERGYKTETWIPAAPLRASTTVPEPASSVLGHSQDRQSQDQAEHSGSWAGHRQQGPEHPESGRRQPPPWMTQFRETLDGEEDASTEAIRMEDR
jgi:hypothetical protein